MPYLEVGMDAVVTFDTQCHGGPLVKLFTKACLGHCKICCG